jgi:hypothetical protein
MQFTERLKKFLQEEETAPKDFKETNKNPESAVDPEASLEVPKDARTLQQFLTLVNPLRGEVKRSALFRYVSEFRKRGKDVLILKGVKGQPAELLPFFSVDRGQLSAYLASIMDDDEAMKDFTSQIETIYTTEECEMAPVDYMDFVIKNKISIMSNPAVEQFGVDAASESIPSINEPKNQEKLETDPQKVEDSEGLDKKAEE